ncbi:MAG: type II secretion system protein GspG [Planctomycetota bacterium]|jgi:type II secretion system protein G
MSDYNYGGEYEVPARTSDLAVYSLIAGVLSYVILPFVGAIAAVIMGHMALGEIKRSGGALGGRGMAVGGLVLGYIQILAVPLLVVLAVLAMGFLMTASMDERESAMAEAVAEAEAERNAKIAEQTAHQGEEVAKAQVMKFGLAVEKYDNDMDALPPQEKGLFSLMEAPEGEGKAMWKGPYIREIPLDPWGKPYQYRVIETEKEGEKAVIFSLGPDGRESKDDILWTMEGAD